MTPKFLAVIAACSVFLLSPYIPLDVLKLVVGNRVGAFLLIGLVIYALVLDNTIGLAVFLAACALFLEQRRRTVEIVKEVQGSGKESLVDNLIVPAPNIVPGEVHPSKRDAEVDDYSFEPTEESGTNTYDKVGESYNEKDPLDTVPPQPNEVSELLQQKGLASI
jgi:hypothetical protein